MNAFTWEGERSSEELRHDALVYVHGIVRTVREPLVVLDLRLRVLSANRSFYRTFRLSPLYVEGQSLFELGHRRWDIPRLRALLEDIGLHGTAFEDFEIEHDFPDIGRKIMLMNARGLRRAGAELILLAIEDVTDRRRTEAERHAIESHFASLVKNIEDHAIFTLDAEGRVASWNLAAERILGYSEEEALGQDFAFVFTADDRRRGVPEAELCTARAQGRAEDERWHLRKNGELLWALGIVSALHDAEGRPIGFSKILRDMTTWKSAERALRESEKWHRTLFDSIDEGVCLFERLPLRADGLRDYRYIAMNPAMQAMFRIPDLSGQSIRDSFPDEIEDWYDDYDRVLETGRPIRFERESAPQGMVLEMFVARVEDGSSKRLLAVMKDVTARRRAEEALRRSEERFRALVQASAAVVYRMSPDWTEMRWLVGRDFVADAEESNRTWLQRYIPAEDRREVMAAIGEAIRSKSVFELAHRSLRTDGRLGWTFSRAIPLFDEAGEIVEWFGTASDITERKRAEEALRQSEIKYRSLFESIDQGFCIIEMIFDERDEPVDYRVIETNPAFERQTGLSNAKGRTARALVPAHENYWFEIYGRVALSGEAMRFQNYAAQLHRWYEVYAWPYGQAQERQLALLFNDISLRKQAEEALQEANRRKDVFLATLAHELRNPLAPMRGGLDLLRKLRGDAAACEKPLRIMERQMTHLIRLVDDLLDVARIGQGKIRLRKEPLDLAEIVEAALAISETRLRRGERRLTVTLPSTPLPVEGDRVRLVQIVSNLLNNAAKFTDSQGHVSLQLIPRTDRIDIRVQDDGRGIPREQLGEIFEMFAQAEPSPGQGLGIGLHLVRRLVAMHGGTVSAESEGPGRGATFTVSLPLGSGVFEPPAAREATHTEGQVPRRRVLVVDDNHDAAVTLAMLLSVQEAEVRVAHGGAEAIRIFEDWQPTHVFMDLGMPDMDGYEVSRRLRAGFPERVFRLVAITGWGQEEVRHRTREAGFDEHLLKPVGIADLTAALSR